MHPKLDHQILRLVAKLLEQTQARQHPGRPAYYALAHAVREIQVAAQELHRGHGAGDGAAL